MGRVTIRLPDDLDDDVEECVGYGSKSQFYRDAAEEKLARDGVDGYGEQEDTDTTSEEPADD